MGFRKLLYYAMGLALTMEGVMSACYHVCPTKITFQFDTTFMYVIAIIMFMKLYQVINMPMQNRGENFFFQLFKFFQARHADVSADAMVVFLGLGTALLLEIISIYYSSKIFWFIFCIVSFLLFCYLPFRNI